MPRTRFLPASLLTLCVAVLCLVAPAAAQASFDLAITQTPSAHVVAPGGTVTISSTVKNVGSVADPEVDAELDSLAAHGAGANNPYQSFTVSQGQCAIESGQAYGYTYHYLVCRLGELAPGQSARIEATVQVNQTAVHSAVLLGGGGVGLLTDDNSSDNTASDRITVNAPPVVTGSKQIKLSGLPKGCASEDFTFTASTAVKGVKKMRASLFEADFEKTVRGHRIVAKIPVSHLEFQLGQVYTVKIKAKRGSAGALLKTVSFEVC
jgi:Domain of unknown function DUF11